MIKPCPRPGCRGQMSQDREEPGTLTCLLCSRSIRENFVPLDIPKPRHRLVDEQWKEAS